MCFWEPFNRDKILQLNCGPETRKNISMKRTYYWTTIFHKDSIEINLENTFQSWVYRFRARWKLFVSYDDARKAKVKWTPHLIKTSIKG